MPSVPEQALEWLERVKSHQVTVVGEDIIDEYVHVRPAGKSAKENLVTFVETGRQMWAGGARVIHKHLEALGCESTLLTSERPVIKTRYVDTAFNQKMFSVCGTDSINGFQAMNRAEYPHLLVADFGHLQGRWDSCGRFISLMVQSNSLNWGFNLLTKYQRADYIVCDEAELRLALRDAHTPTDGLIKKLGFALDCKRVTVTLGHLGAMIWDGDGFDRFPTYTRKVTDRMGAGDAFLAASAPLAAMGAPTQVVGLVGSVVAGLHVEKEGNPPLCREELVARLKELV